MLKFRAFLVVKKQYVNNYNTGCNANNNSTLNIFSIMLQRIVVLLCTPENSITAENAESKITKKAFLCVLCVLSG